jgi:hypothetical protein
MGPTGAGLADRQRRLRAARAPHAARARTPARGAAGRHRTPPARRLPRRRCRRCGLATKPR